MHNAEVFGWFLVAMGIILVFAGVFTILGFSVMKVSLAVVLVCFIICLGSFKH